MCPPFGAVIAIDEVSSFNWQTLTTDCAPTTTDCRFDVVKRLLPNPNFIRLTGHAVCGLTQGFAGRAVKN